MSVELLNQDTVVEYLIDKKVISSGDNPQVEVLTGGVSNVVLAITTRSSGFTNGSGVIKASPD